MKRKNTFRFVLFFLATMLIFVIVSCDDGSIDHAGQNGSADPGKYVPVRVGLADPRLADHRVDQISLTNDFIPRKHLLPGNYSCC